eukprot:Skav235636  [mRNA]  locus=scaffold358:435916:438350:- [translate_table: standard]
MDVAFVASRAPLGPGDLSRALRRQPWAPQARQTQVNAELAGASVLAACVVGAKALPSRKCRSFPRRSGRAAKVQRCSSSDLKKLVHLGGTASEKALDVNLDSKFYGSFAEIGAGQEVSRTFLTAGAAAGTVARSMSAYDMKMSDLDYGKAKRYVTQERLQQMLDTEYDIVESNLRSVKGDELIMILSRE